MEKKYSDAFRSGIKAGIAIAVIYGLITLIGVGINHTHEMVSYMDQLSQYNKDMLNQSYSGYGGVPYTYSHPMPRPPLLYDVTIILSFVIYAVLALGFIITGIYTMKKAGLVKYGFKDIAYMGTLAAIGSLVPIIFIMVLVNIINLLVNGSMVTSVFSTFSSVYGSMPAAVSSIMYVVIAGELLCCCLPIGILVPVILSIIGAIGYVLATGKLEHGSAQA